MFFIVQNKSQAANDGFFFHQRESHNMLTSRTSLCSDAKKVKNKCNITQILYNKYIYNVNVYLASCLAHCAVLDEIVQDASIDVLLTDV